jgi:pyruvate formate lyase activating enzyme
MEARFYDLLDEKLICQLCPHHCRIPEGKTGKCQVRRNINGKLVAETWGHLSAVHFDPVEKKPLYHYNPGKIILSLGSVGCNMKCTCCQNWHISQSPASGYPYDRSMSPAEIARLASTQHENIGVAYTYNEPTVWYEYMLDIARLIRFDGRKNVMVSNGFICEPPLRELMDYMDAFNIDLKGFSGDFYRKFAGAQLKPVLENLIRIRKAGKHLEITTLIIPGLNDDPKTFREMTGWIAKELGEETVLHLSRYHPAYQLNISATPLRTLEDLHNVARERLAYVYVGNVQIGEYQNTFCSRCHQTVIRRNGYHVEIKSLTAQGACAACGNPVVSC